MGIFFSLSGQKKLIVAGQMYWPQKRSFHRKSSMEKKILETINKRTNMLSLRLPSVWYNILIEKAQFVQNCQCYSVQNSQLVSPLCHLQNRTEYRLKYQETQITIPYMAFHLCESSYVGPIGSVSGSTSGRYHIYGWKCFDLCYVYDFYVTAKLLPEIK
jgi:hypothetical protein